MRRFFVATIFLDFFNVFFAILFFPSLVFVSPSGAMPTYMQLTRQCRGQRQKALTPLKCVKSSPGRDMLSRPDGRRALIKSVKVEFFSILSRRTGFCYRPPKEFPKFRTTPRPPAV